MRDSHLLEEETLQRQLAAFRAHHSASSFQSSSYNSASDQMNKDEEEWNLYISITAISLFLVIYMYCHSSWTEEECLQPHYSGSAFMPPDKNSDDDITTVAAATGLIRRRRILTRKVSLVLLLPAFTLTQLNEAIKIYASTAHTHY